MPLWKIILRGDTPSEVHGVNLRESIKQATCVMDRKGVKIHGYVRNLKGKNKVEILCKTDSEKDRDIFRESINHIRERNILVDERVMEESCTPIEDTTQDFNGFEIIREDELTEMVWALQAAGKAFFKQEEIRERVRKENMMRGVFFEIESIKIVLEQIKKDNSGKMRIRLIAIENFLREPPADCIEIVTNLHALHIYCDIINTMLNDGDAVEKMPLDEIENCIEAVKKTPEGDKFKKEITASKRE